jgi:hypothetical protein
MSDTPETDAEIKIEMTCACYPNEYVSGDFARKLERERDEAIFSKNTSAADFLKQIRQITLCKDVAREKLLMAEKERDETRKQFVDFLNKTEDYKRERDEGYQKITDLESELRGVGLLRDEAIRQLENIKASSIHTCHDQCQRPMCVLRRERDEAQKELSSIHRWIDKNHADGFIDSLTYLQNLERVADNWYDRLDRLEIDAGRFERERDEAREALRELWQTADPYIPQIDEEQTTKWHNAMALHTTLQKVK